MAQLAVDDNEIEAMRVELAELARSVRRSFQSFRSNGRTSPVINDPEEYYSDSDVEAAIEDDDNHFNEQWAAIERLPTYERTKLSLFDNYSDDQQKGKEDGKRVVDVRKLKAPERRVFIEKLIKNIENDNLRLLQKLRDRIDRVGVQIPSVEVRYKNLCVEAECEVVRGKPLPTLWNSLRNMFNSLLDFTKLLGSKSQKAKISILNDISGVIKPKRMTLLLGPPGSGRTTLMLALSGKLNQSLKVTGDISYNGHKLEEFVPQKTAAYISQHDLHIAEMTVRETLDFSACCQGVGSRAEIMMDVSRGEKQAGINPDPDVDMYMKAISVEGTGKTIQTDYILKILGLDICADSMVGDAMRRGISGGQKKRVTTGEMIVGPTKALFMDEISTGLDSSTTFQIVSCLQHLVHLTDATALISLLQPAPETYSLFDDIILMAEGKIVYHGPRSYILEFFEYCGFRCPERKGEADFLQEVVSKKDQAQYWHHNHEPYRYISVDEFREKFKAFHVGKKLDEELSDPYDKSQSHKNALSLSLYSLSKWELFKACISREFLLVRRNSFVYVFKSTQLLFIASVTMTVFIRTRMHIDSIHANYYLGSLFYGLITILVDGFPEISMTVSRLAVFYKQRDCYFYPAWAYGIPSAIVKVPLSVMQSLVWTGLTYYVIGYSPEFGRFLRQYILFFAMHLMAMSMFRFVASVSRTLVASMTAGSLTMMIVFLFGGFILPHPYMPTWIKWGFWMSPLTYGEIGATLNEFLAPRWQIMSTSTNITLGHQVLQGRGLDFRSYFYWISLAALFGFTILFNLGYVLALTFLKPPGMSHAIISQERLAQMEGKADCNNSSVEEKSTNGHPDDVVEAKKGRMALPFEPLTMTFQNLDYYIDTPAAMRDRGFTQKKLQLLHDITSAFRPGVLTALMGVSGAGKTTLMDVLSGRKTAGTIAGEIKIGGYPKVQKTFARISGYCEQNDIHSPQITVEESVTYSAWLRLSPEIDSKTKAEFVNEVLETIELDGIKDTLVGTPGVSGLSTEQRKRLTIAVELVANPSIIFMDEPTSGLDARAAAIVMRAVKNVVGMGRTVVCTIHQPSTDIFESFDELILMKRGGRLIYAGPLGQHSSRVIKYFEELPGVPKIKDNYNPATWMLEVTSTSAEADLGVDFAEIYRESSINKENVELVKQLSTPPPGSKDLHFSTRFPQNGWGQFKACLWKQYLSYWRSPSYNLRRFAYTFIASVVLGILFWKKGKKINTQQDLINVLGAQYVVVQLLGVNLSSSVLPFVSTERTVFYRERAAGMYSPWAYSFAQVVIEIPYLLVQTFIYVIITYPMFGFHVSAYKIFWYYYAMFCVLAYFNYLGMMLLSLTPSVHVAATLSSAFYTMLNLFSGYLMPKPEIPKWWLWLYYLCPTSWTLKGILTSQYGDSNKMILAFGEPETISSFLGGYLGYHYDQLGFVAMAVIAFPIAVALVFAYSLGKLNFQKR
ncbi:hypothetical protein NE237_002380 [Protea cynaroides]|uniref:ABC transporter domain-containing protein n=1 Tax=Protea cynaroides TaxID=273540 RepID=A0A9Q0KW13_9MAGN|nr:hypothetical protein NE237_002380 [Protea cynaroides]